MADDDNSIDVLLNGPDPEEPETEEEEKGAEPEESGERDERGEPDERQERQTVPLAALQEEREQRQYYQRSFNDMSEKLGRMEAVLERLQQGPEKKPEPLPDFDDDPEGYLKKSTQLTQEQLAQIQERFQNEDRQRQQQAQVREFMGRYAGAAQEFARAAPDFNEAYAYLANAIDEDLQYRGFDNPAERRAIMENEEAVIVQRAFQAGKNPAEILYNYAQKRGWRKGAAQGKTEDDNKLSRLKQGQKASQSLSGSNARSEGNVTIERLSELAKDDPAAFDREWAKAAKKGLLG